MRWPCLRFDRFFEIHLRNKAMIQLGIDRDNMLQAISTNPNWDTKENQEARRDRVQQILVDYKEGIEILSGTREALTPVEDPFEVDPLFNPIRVKVEEARQQIGSPVQEHAGAGAQLLQMMP